ncbi:MAG: hypothetical protein WBG70_03155 [Spirulinaceae cyanobacterium]
MNTQTEIVTLIFGKGIVNDDSIHYEMNAQVDSNTGKFSGNYKIDSDGLIGKGIFRRAAKRLWDLKLKLGGTGPNIPQSIYELGGFDLTINSKTTHLSDGESYDSFTRVSGIENLAQIDIIFKESSMGNAPESPLQISYSIFENARPGQVRFLTHHRDDQGEHSITQGMIFMNGNPTGVLPTTIRTNFYVEFDPLSDAEVCKSIGGKFRGGIKIIEEDSTLPYNPADYFRTYDHKVSGAGAVVLYKYVPEISTLGIEFERYPDKEKLPAILNSEDGKLSVLLRSDISGTLHLSALMEVEHAVCNDKMCNVSQTYCVNSPLWRCYCTYFHGVPTCHHEPCSSRGGGGGGVQLGAVDFTAVVPGGEW